MHQMQFIVFFVVFFSSLNANEGESINNALKHKVGSFDDIACSEDSQPRVLTDLNGWFTSPNYPDDYPEGLTCQWLIVTEQPGHIIQLDFDFFQTQVGQDVVSVYDGDSTLSPIIAAFEGNWWNPPPTGIRSSGEQLLLEFTSDSFLIVDIGFNVTYTSTPLVVTEDPCYALSRPVVLKDYSGTFKTNGYPTSNYWNFADCQWLIESQADEGAVLFQFDFFATEDSYDFLRFYDGNSSTALLIAGIHGNLGTSPSLTLRSTSPQVFVQFTSDAIIPDVGFSVSYSTLPTTSCGTTLSVAPSNVTASPGYNALCYMDASNLQFETVQCYDLVQNIPGIGNANQLLSAGGNFGCLLSTREDFANAADACYDGYQWASRLSQCPGCVRLIVCIRYPRK